MSDLTPRPYLSLTLYLTPNLTLPSPFTERVRERSTSGEG